jgi:hypothetical protein
MVSVVRYPVAVAVTLISACATPINTSLPISKHDHTTRWWGNPSYGPQQHYVHVVRDSRGQIKDVFRYYLDEHGQPVLDGDRYIYRFEHDPGLIIEYRDGREVRRSEAIVTG